ncbi:MAG TPA: type II toxin-antitoxin system prevent-host-death family antitoxin [Candidatus Acidoferrales bacterium]|nr:type II toxin-antitoxin system prevent-host-death family antitoxin [Candidatus Acidoferrales bacterium]
MASIGAFEAKTHLSALLERVRRGERITITRNGIPTAMLVPVDDGKARPSYAEILDGMRRLRKSVKGGKIRVRELVEEGRRF